MEAFAHHGTIKDEELWDEILAGISKWTSSNMSFAQIQWMIRQEFYQEGKTRALNIGMYKRGLEDLRFDDLISLVTIF